MDGPPPLAAAMLPASGVASGEFYWVSDDKSAWVACRCERTGARATLTRPDGSTAAASPRFPDTDYCCTIIEPVSIG